MQASICAVCQQLLKYNTTNQQTQAPSSLCVPFLTELSDYYHEKHNTKGNKPEHLQRYLLSITNWNRHKNSLIYCSRFQDIKNIVQIFKSAVKALFYVNSNLFQTDVIAELETYCSLIETILPKVYKLQLHTVIVCLETVLT